MKIKQKWCISIFNLIIQQIDVNTDLTQPLCSLVWLKHLPMIFFLNNCISTNESEYKCRLKWLNKIVLFKDKKRNSLSFVLAKMGALLSDEFEAGTMFVAPLNVPASEEALRGLIALDITRESSLSSSPGVNFWLMYSFMDTPLSHTWLPLQAENGWLIHLSKCADADGEVTLIINKL